MSYQSPDILLLTNPVGIDAVIQSIQQELYAGLTWLEKSFGRAWEFTEKDPETGKEIKVPKCYIGEGEYVDVLYNDFLKSHSFISVRGEETISDDTFLGSIGRERKLSVIFWVNLKDIDPTKDYIFTEELKQDVENVLRANGYVKTIDRYYDERDEDVFDGNASGAMSGRFSVPNNKLLMYPYAGFRFDLTVGYNSNKC